MSCGCDSGYDGYGYDGTYGVCTPDIPYPNVSHESVPSLIDNLVTALYGAFFDPNTQTGYVTKYLKNGRIVWNIACDPNNTATVAGVPRNQGEGLLCYLLRVLQNFNPTQYSVITAVETLPNKTLASPAFTGTLTFGTSVATGGNWSAITAGSATNLANGSAGAIPYQTGSGATSFLSAGPAGYVLSSAGPGQTPAWTVNSSVTTSAQNLVGAGIAGNLVYQTGTNTTGFVANGTSGQILQSNGTASPSWINLPTTASSATNLTGTTANTIPYQSASGTTAYLPTGTNGQILSSRGSSSSPLWITLSSIPGANNILGSDGSGGLIGSLPYQSATGTTTFLSPGAAGTVLSSNGPGLAPSWITNTSVSSSANNLIGGNSGYVPYQTAAGQTSFVPAGNAGQLLQSNGSSAPTWVNPSVNSNASNLVSTSGNTFGIPYQSGVTQTSFLNPGTTGYVLSTNSTSGAPSWVNAIGNLSGGDVGSIPYQTASGTTAMLAAGSTNAVLQMSGTGLPVWGSVSSTVPHYRNKVINGNMLIDQRNAGYQVTSVAGKIFPVDRFFLQCSNAGNFTAQQITNSTSTPLATSAASSGGVFINVATAVSSPAANDKYFFRHDIEQSFIGDILAQSSQPALGLSFYVYASGTGRYPVAVYNVPRNISYVGYYNVTTANTWQKITISIPATSLNSTTNLLTDGSVGLSIIWDLGSGSSSTVTGSGLQWYSGGYTKASTQIYYSFDGTQGAQLAISQVQLEIGQASSFEYLPTFDTLALCRRYYETSYYYSGIPIDWQARGLSPSTTAKYTNAAHYRGALNNNAQAGGFIPISFKTTKCTTSPTVTIINPFTGGSNGVYDLIGNTSYGAGLTNYFGCDEGAIYFSGGTTSNGYVDMVVHWTASSELT